MKAYIALISLVVLYEIIRWGIIGIYRDIKRLRDLHNSPKPREKK